MARTVGGTRRELTSTTNLDYHCVQIKESVQINESAQINESVQITEWGRRWQIG